MRVIVVGANAGGMSFASKLKREVKDCEILVFDSSDEISYGACGLPYYLGGLFESTKEVNAKTKEDFEKEGIGMRVKEEVRGVNFDEKVVYTSKGEEAYDKLVIATGSSPILPDLPGIDLEGVYTLKSPRDAEKILQGARKAKNITIVGAGYIGLELVESFLNLGKEVRLIQRGDRILPIMDKEITDILEVYLADKIDLVLGHDVKEIKGTTRPEKVISDKGEFDTDMVVMAIGVRPMTGAFDALDMLEDGSIIVNDRLESSIKDVYAVGDCASKKMKNSEEIINIQLGTYANRQGKILAEIMAGKAYRFPEILGTSMIKVMDYELASTGLNEAAAKENFNAGSVFIEKDLFPSYYPRESKASCKLIYDKDTKQILGAQLIGGEATAQRINTFALAIANEMKAYELEYADLGYQPAFSTVWDIFQVASSQAD